MAALVRQTDLHGGLKESQALIVLASPRETGEEEVAVLARQLLTEDERERRFFRQEDRHDYIIARSLLRLGLSHCFPVESTAWCFQRDEKQKPFVVSPMNLQPFQFSLSHTCGLVALLVAFAPQAGIDVEYLRRANDLPLVARRVCAPNELSALEQLRGEEWNDRFFQLWTLKEAYSKARGTGLALPFDKVTFDIDARGAVAVKFADEIHDHEETWRFDCRKVGPDHMLSAALAQQGVGIKIRKVRVAVFGDSPHLEFV